MKRIFFALAGALGGLCSSALPAHALSVPTSSLTAGPSSEPSGEPDAERPARTASRPSRETRPSLLALLQLRPSQGEKLGRLYDNYAVERLEREDRVMRLESQLGLARASGDREEAARLTSEIGEAKQQVISDLLAARAKALKALTSVQRAQLKAAQADTRSQLRPDKYFQLLLLPASEVWAARVPSPSQAQFDDLSSSADPRDYGRDERGGRSRSRSSRSSRSRGGSYGVYGGYGYGRPQYGVYGNYGQGGVGVHAGIGRGGLSVGVGVGRVFGYGR